MRKILCRKWPQSTDPLISLFNSLRKCHGSVLCGHFRHIILRTFLAHHDIHLGTISWTIGPYFAPIFDTIFCAHFWYIMPTIWAPFHGPNGPPFLERNICKCLDSVNVWILGSLAQPHQLPSLFFSSPLRQQLNASSTGNDLKYHYR